MQRKDLVFIMETMYFRAPCFGRLMDTANHLFLAAIIRHPLDGPGHVYMFESLFAWHSLGFGTTVSHDLSQADTRSNSPPVHPICDDMGHPDPNGDPGRLTCRSSFLFIFFGQPSQPRYV